MSHANREALLRLSTILRPALSTQSFIPALSHIHFKAGSAVAYNDVTAIEVKAEFEGLQDCCVPGELLIKALGSFKSEEVRVDELDGGSLLLTAGRSKMKVPFLEGSAFPYKPPTTKPHVVELSAAVLEGVRRCLFAVGTDPTHPAHMGVTLDTLDGCAVLYSTDNFTLSRYNTSYKIKLPADSPIILPTFFCEQLLALAKNWPEEEVDLEIYPGAIQAVIGKKAKVLTKTLVDLEPLDFGKIIDKYLAGGDVRKALNTIPDSFDAAWNRALLVLSGEADKATKVTATKDGFTMLSTSAVGESEDSLEFEGDFPKACEKFHVDPTMVVRAAKTCGQLAFYPRVVVLATDDANFIHLIAHVVG